jgi:hypothetical protein
VLTRYLLHDGLTDHMRIVRHAIEALRSVPPVSRAFDGRSCGLAAVTVYDALVARRKADGWTFVLVVSMAETG